MNGIAPAPSSSSHSTSDMAPQLPEYKAIAASVNVPAVVSMIAIPLFGTVNEYQRSSELLKLPQPGAGGPVVVVAHVLSPDVYEHVVPTVSGVAEQGASFV